MRNWKHKIQLGDVFHNDDLEWHVKVKAIADRFSVLDKPFEGTDELIDLHDLVEELREQANPDDFDEVWDVIYDWCDQNSVWLETFRIKTVG